MSTQNYRIQVKPDYAPVQVTGATFYDFIGSGCTAISDVAAGNQHTITINTPCFSGVTQLQFDSYTGATEVRLQGIEDDIVYLSGQTDNKLDTTIFSDYTGDTEITLSGLTWAGIVLQGQVNGLEGAFETYTGVTAPAQFAAKAHLHTGVYSPTGHTHTGVYAPVVHTHPYSGLTGLPTLFSGDYDDLTNKPDLSVYQPVSGMSIYLTGVTWNDVTDKPDLTLQSDFTGHTSDTSIHYPMSGISITESQISDFGDYTTTGTTQALSDAFDSHTGNTVIHFSGHTFTASGITQISQVGDNVNIYVPADSITGVTWGSITGTLSGQTDLQLALNSKLESSVYQGDMLIIGGEIDGLISGLTTHTGDTTIHFTIAEITGFTTTSDFTGHTSDTSIHYAQSAITITESQVTDLPTDLSYLQDQIDDLSQLQTSDRIYIFEHTDSDIPTYETLSIVLTQLSAVTETVALTLAGGETLIDSYATEALGVTGISSGVWTVSFHAYVNSLLSGRITNMRFKAYRRDTGGTETLLGTSTDILINSTTIKAFQLSMGMPAFTGWTLQDRLVVKVYGQSNNTTTLYWTYNSSEYSAFLQVPIYGITTLPWSSVTSKPAWIEADSAAEFATGHTHSQYLTGYTVTAGDVTGITASLYVPILNTGTTYNTDISRAANGGLVIQTKKNTTPTSVVKSTMTSASYLIGLYNSGGTTQFGSYQFLNNNWGFFSWYDAATSTEYFYAATKDYGLLANSKIDYDDESIGWGQTLAQIEATFGDRSLINKHYADTRYSQTGHTHSQYLTGYTVTAGDVTGITASLYAPIVHTHAYSAITDTPDLSVYQPVSGMSVYLTGVTWNIITGDISGSTALQNALNLKLDNSAYQGDMLIIGGEIDGLISGLTTHTGDTTIHFLMSAITGFTTTSDFTGHTGNTAIHFEMNDITGFTSTDDFNTYTGTTAPAQFVAKTATIVTLTASTILNSTYASKIVEVNSTGATTITLYSGATTGTRIDIVNVNTGDVTIAAQGTLQSDGTKLATQYTGASVYARGTSTWLAVGKLTT